MSLIFLVYGPWIFWDTQPGGLFSSVAIKITWTKMLCKGRQGQEQKKHKNQRDLCWFGPAGPSRSHPPKILSFSGLLITTTISTFSGVGSKEGGKQTCGWRGQSRCRQWGREAYFLLEKARFSFYLVDSFHFLPSFAPIYHGKYLDSRV